MNSDSFDPIGIALQEDIGSGDITTQFLVPPQLKAHGRIIRASAASSLEPKPQPQSSAGSIPICEWISCNLMACGADRR